MNKLTLNLWDGIQVRRRVQSSFGVAVAVALVAALTTNCGGGGGGSNPADGGTDRPAQMGGDGGGDAVPVSCGNAGEPCCGGNSCNGGGCCIPRTMEGGPTTRTCVA